MLQSPKPAASGGYDQRVTTPPSFAAAIDVVPLEAPSEYLAQLYPEWSIGGKPNGGYLMAVMARAAHLEVAAVGQSHPHCIAAATTFAGSPDSSSATVTVEILRKGLGATQCSVRLHQGSGTLVESQMTFVRLRSDAERRYDDLEAPHLPPMSECARMIPNPDGVSQVRVMEGTNVRMDRATMGWASGEISQNADLRGWAEFFDGESPTAESLLFFLDCMPPATFQIASKGWVPTVQLTSYVRALPAPGPLKIRQYANVVDGGFVDEVCHVWDSTDRLVAQAVQLAKVRF